MGHGDDNLSGEGDDNFGWNSDDDREMDNYPQSSCSSSTPHVGEATSGFGKASSSGGTSNSKLFYYFVSMGYSKEMVAEAIRENGDENENLILEFLLAYSARSFHGSSKSKLFDDFVSMGYPKEMVARAVMENGEQNPDLILDALQTYSVLEISPEKQQVEGSFAHGSSDHECSLMEDFSDDDGYLDSKVIRNRSFDEEGKMLILMEMGYTEDEASIAMGRCGTEASVDELADFICAARMAGDTDALNPEKMPKPKILCSALHKRRRSEYERKKGEKKKKKKKKKKTLREDDGPLRLPKPMIGFGVPSESCSLTHRNLPEAAIGPPYFYYENVALAPKGVWDTISRFLYDIEPEFVDSKYFCAAGRKRGYVHNLPIKNRYLFRPLRKLTIQEALPNTRRWWPSWDTRTQLNCLLTCVGSARFPERIRKALEDCDDNSDPPPHIQKHVLGICRQWNLVWVGRNKVATLEPDEVESLLGFPNNHTRGGGINRTDRYKSLGNAFQVDTVAYHLSVLKNLYPGGINVLSLFSGIGGAEVALHGLGIPLKNVVAVEKSAINRTILRCWWEQTNQQGNLTDIEDVEQLDGDRLEQLMSSFGGFDLVIGGSPCNNLAGRNLYHRDGLQGKESSLFYDYCRILDLVKCMMSTGHSNGHS